MSNNFWTDFTPVGVYINSVRKQCYVWLSILQVVHMPLRPKDAYIDHLSRLDFGLPLFTPSNVELGDVGFINRDGAFQRLYNITKPDTKIPNHPPPEMLSYGNPDLTDWHAIHVCSCFLRASGLSYSFFNADACEFKEQNRCVCTRQIQPFL